MLLCHRTCRNVVFSSRSLAMDDGALLEPARLAHKYLNSFVEACASQKKSPACLEQAKALVSSLSNEFEVRAGGRQAKASKGAKTVKSKRQVLKSLQYQKSKVKKLEKVQKQEISPRDGLRITRSWLVRTMLADPALPSGTLASLCNQFAMEECQTISQTTVSHVRDSFVEILKQMNKLRAKRAFQDQAGSCEGQVVTVYAVHIHDGADMKMRSYENPNIVGALEVPATHFRLSRSRSCKIQNHSVHVWLGTRASMPWFTELMSMSKKDQTSIASSIIIVLKDIWTGLHLLPRAAEDCSASKCNFVHLLTGDSINTNEAAARCVLQHCWHILPASVQYRLLVFRCAAHKCNLVTVTAICGRSLGTLKLVFNFFVLECL